MSYSFDGSSGNVIVTDNTVAGNTSTYGGGIWALSYGPVGPGNVTVMDNFVEGNTATGGNAGGIYADSHAVTADSGTVTVSRNTVIDNSTSGGNNLGKGGGVYAETNCATSGNGGDVLLSENIVSGNSGRVGGGVYAETNSFTQTGGVVRLYNNTITGNTTERDAGMNGAPEIRTRDFEDDQRVVDGDDNGSALVDIGADEFVRQVNGAAAIVLLLLSP